MCYGNILEASLRKARKVHLCLGCNRPIRPGRQYERVTGVDNGDFWSSNWHKRCIAVADVTEPHDDDGCILGDPREANREHAQAGGWRDLLRRARAMLAHRNRRWQEQAALRKAARAARGGDSGRGRADRSLQRARQQPNWASVPLLEATRFEK